MDELVAFLKAQLDEDQAVAMSAAADAAKFAGRPNWSAEIAPIVTDAEDIDWAIADLSPWVDDECLARHIARHDPARALREVTAKRAHLAAYESAVRGCLAWGIVSVLEDIVRSDAAVYSDHPGYRAEWAV